MNGILIEPRPYNEPNILCLAICASNGTYSGAVEVFATHEELAEFGTQLMKFPVAQHHAVSFEYGDDSGEFAYHLILQARTLDPVGHSGLFVRMHSLVGVPESASVEFCIPSEAASLNDLGDALRLWIDAPSSVFSWSPRA